MRDEADLGLLGMLFPIRCFSCGALIADKWEEYVRRVEEGEAPGKVLDDLGVKRYCCRRMFLSHYEYFDEIIKLQTLYGSKPYPKAEGEEESGSEA